MDADFFSIHFFKKIDFEFVSKSYDRFTEPPLSYGFEGVVPTQIRNWVNQQR
jgi:hypothetical protein